MIVFKCRKLFSCMHQNMIFLFDCGKSKSILSLSYLHSKILTHRICMNFVLLVFCFFFVWSDSVRFGSVKFCSFIFIFRFKWNRINTYLYHNIHMYCEICNNFVQFLNLTSISCDSISRICQINAGDMPIFWLIQQMLLIIGDIRRRGEYIWFDLPEAVSMCIGIKMLFFLLLLLLLLYLFFLRFSVIPFVFILLHWPDSQENASSVTQLED